jgi:hypothetical protein
MFFFYPETSVNFYQARHGYIPENCTLSMPGLQRSAEQKWRDSKPFISSKTVSNGFLLRHQGGKHKFKEPSPSRGLDDGSSGRKYTRLSLTCPQDDVIGLCPEHNFSHTFKLIYFRLILIVSTLCISISPVLSFLETDVKNGWSYTSSTIRLHCVVSNLSKLNGYYMYHLL